MVCENFGDRQAMVRVLPRDVSQGRDFDTRVHGQVFQSLPIIIGHIVGVVRHGYVGANGVEGGESVGNQFNGGARSTLDGPGTKQFQHKYANRKFQSIRVYSCEMCNPPIQRRGQ